MMPYKKINNKSGFTLIELMIVVAIVGILAVITIPNFLNYQAKSSQVETKTSLGAIFVDMTAYSAENVIIMVLWMRACQISDLVAGVIQGILTA